jgi:hypothetical protein
MARQQRATQKKAPPSWAGQGYGEQNYRVRCTRLEDSRLSRHHVSLTE